MNAPAPSSLAPGQIMHAPASPMPAWLSGIVGSLELAMPVAQMLSKSGMVPQAYAGKPEAIIVAGAMGARLGLDLFSALAGIAVINGKPTIWGDAMLAVVQSHPAFEDLVETLEGEWPKDECRAICTVHRRGRQPYTQEFTVGDAKKAGLWTKQGPWSSTPKRMLQMRARAFALRGAFADALAGFHAREEVEDLEDVTASASVRAEPQPAKRRMIKEAAPAAVEPAAEGCTSTGEDAAAQPGHTPGDAAAAPAAGEEAAKEAKADPAPRGTTVDDCKRALTALWKGNKEAAAAVLAAWKIQAVAELAGSTDADRAAFLDDVAEAASKPGSGQ